MTKTENNSVAEIIRNLGIEGCLLDKNGIASMEVPQDHQTLHSKNVWEKIYDFDQEKLKKDRNNFFRDKIDDHVRLIFNDCAFNPNDIFLEIGSGPSYVGEYAMEKFNLTYVGIDFNYQVLLSVKKYFEKKGLTRFLLIYGDIRSIPLKDNAVDFIYGGGVIEHFPDTCIVLKELRRVLKPCGVSFNTVPCFNLSWIPLRSFANIPSGPRFLKSVFEFLHISVLRNRVLDKFYGYELSFTINALRKVHELSGFKEVRIGPFPCHPFSSKLSNAFLRNLYFNVQRTNFTSFFYYAYARK